MGVPYYDIDVLAVGDGERSGDAIAMRYSLDGLTWQVLVIDGGNLETGAKLVRLIRREYGTNIANDVLNTHPDSDHSSGLSIVLEEMQVNALWMHRPWAHLPHMLDEFDDGRLTPNSAAKRVAEALRCAAKVHDLAVEKRIPVYEPFAGATIGGLTVLSPTLDLYRALLPHFRSTPDAVRPSPLVGSGGLTALGFSRSALAEALAAFAVATQANEDAALGVNPTAAENETSVVLAGQFGTEVVLFTGDAGPVALETAVLMAARAGISLKNLRLLQLPHHGSRNNLTPTLLSKISAKTAFVSVAAKSPTHPRRSVTNALQRRGTKVFATQGTSLHFRLNREMRPGWSDVSAVPWYDMIEAA